MANPETETRGMRKERKGVVVSRSGNKTIVVLLEMRRRHPKYEKVVRSVRKFHAHDEKNEAGVGDKVRITEARPMSRLKRWRLVEILEKGVGVAATDSDAEPVQEGQQG